MALTLAWTLGIIAIAALLGWGITLFAMTRGILWMVNALGVAERIDARVDNRIQEIVGRLRQRPASPDAPRSNGTVLDEAEEALREAKRRGGMTIPPELEGFIEDQPLPVTD